MENTIKSEAQAAFKNKQTVYFGVVLTYNPAPQNEQQLYVPTDIQVVCYKTPIEENLVENMSTLDPKQVDAQKGQLLSKQAQPMKLDKTAFDNQPTARDIELAYKHIAWEDMKSLAGYKYGEFFAECFKISEETGEYELVNKSAFKKLFDNFYKETYFRELTGCSKTYDPLGTKNPADTEKYVDNIIVLVKEYHNKKDKKEPDSSVELRQAYKDMFMDDDLVKAPEPLLPIIKTVPKKEFMQTIIPQFTRSYTEVLPFTQFNGEQGPRGTAAKEYQKLEEIETLANQVGHTTHSKKPAEKEAEVEQEELTSAEELENEELNKEGEVEGEELTAAKELEDEGLNKKRKSKAPPEEPQAKKPATLLKSGEPGEGNHYYTKASKSRYNPTLLKPAFNTNKQGKQADMQEKETHDIIETGPKVVTPRMGSKE